MHDSLIFGQLAAGLLLDSSAQIAVQYDRNPLLVFVKLIMTQLIISSAYYMLLIGRLGTPCAVMDSLSFLVVKFRNILTYVHHLKL